jgi:hypothetical protein
MVWSAKLWARILTFESDMMLLDMGAEYHCYASDITCSFPAVHHLYSDCIDSINSESSWLTYFYSQGSFRNSRK